MVFSDTDFYNLKAKCVRVRVYFTTPWAEQIPVVGWLGQKSQNATKQRCLPKQFQKDHSVLHNSVTAWVQENSVNCRH